MRSVVVVLPASMCALMPMLRYRLMGVDRGTFRQRLLRWREGIALAPPGVLSVPDSPASEPEMREGLVGLRHAVHFLALLDRAAAALGGLDELGGKALPHRLLAA